MKFCVRLMHVFFFVWCVCPAIYLKTLQEFMNFTVSGVHLLTLMFQIFMEMQDLLRIQSKVGNIFFICSIITHQFVNETLSLIT